MERPVNALAAFLGATLALALDPPVFLIAILVGALSRSRRTFLIAVAITGLAVHLIVSYFVWRAHVRFGEPETLIEVLIQSGPPRLAAFLVIALLSAGLARLCRRLGRIFHERVPPNPYDSL